MIKEEYIAEEISKIEERRLLVMEMRINARKDVNPIEIDEAYQKYYDLLDKKIEKIKKLSDEDYEYLWKVVKKIGSHIRQIIGSPRVGIVVEGFGVPHVHIHLIPIYHGNDLKKPQDRDTEPDHKALAEVASRLSM